MFYYWISFLLWISKVNAFRMHFNQHRLASKHDAGLATLKMGMFDGLKKMVGVADQNEILAQNNEKTIKMYKQTVDEINQLETTYETLSNEELVSKTNVFRMKLQNGASIDSIIVEAFAVVREASWRILKLRHFDVQLIGGLALHNGQLAEMATGEGKTLVALLPSYLNALTGNGVYVVTTNDYLAKRDGENIGQVLRFLGLSVGIIQSYQKEAERKRAYNCDVTYLANQELGFDFLRDNLAMSMENVVQNKPYNFCIIDEADSILIDEAKTPLIISRKGNPPTQKYVTSAQIAKNLVPKVHYEANLKDQKVELTSGGYKFIEQIIGKNLFDLNDPWAFYIINAIKARELFFIDKDYIVKDACISIIDSFSGRVLEGRRFTDGIQQSIEAKENLKITAETQIVAKVTYQNLFRLFPKLSGMSGTAFTEAKEINDVYSMQVIQIPTALPIARRDNTDAVFKSKDGKMKAMLKNILTVNQKGRPILIGTSSVEYSEEVFNALKDLGISAKLLNAKPENVERESETVAQAGRLFSVTVATNMAGRGTDILLGGSSKGIAQSITKYLMLHKLGLFPIPSDFISNFNDQSLKIASTVDSGEATTMTEEFDSDEEIIEETDPDVLSLPSIELIASYIDVPLPKKLKQSTEIKLKRSIISCLDSLGENPDKLAIEDMIAQSIENVPTSDVDLRRLRAALNEVISTFDGVIKKENLAVKNLGGLYVIGTSRHESRRIDQQLRGRSGRQGDPGGTRFFLSLEDDLFRIFGADKIAGMMESFRVAEDMPIESDLVVQALDKIQIQVEDYFRSNRMQILKLDEVASSQRSVVYTTRRAVLSSSDAGMRETFSKYCKKTLQEIYQASFTDASKNSNNKVKGSSSADSQMNLEKLVTKTLQFFPNMKLSVNDLSSAQSDKILDVLNSKLAEAIDDKEKLIDSSSTWKFADFFRYLTLVQTDESWCKHLSRLDLLKEEMVLQSFSAERDVMEIYRERASKLFETLLDEVRRNTVYSLFIYKP